MKCRILFGLSFLSFPSNPLVFAFVVVFFIFQQDLPAET